MEVNALLAFYVVVTLGAYVGAFDFRAYSEPEKDVYDIMDILMRPRKPERFLPNSYFKRFGDRGNTRLTGFSFQDCGSPGRETVKVSQLQLTPDPLHLPGQIGLSFKAVNSKQAESPIQAKVTLKKKIGIWIEVPCMGNVGSCSYSDICKMVPKQQCPPAFKKNKIPCQCPVPAANFTLPGANFRADVSNVPGGDYSVEVEMKSESGPFACLQMLFSIA